MNFRTGLLVIAIAAMSACAQTSAPEVTQFEGQSLTISATTTPGLVDAEFQIFINREMVINQRSQAFGGSSQTFEGTWNGRAVTARATRVQNFMSAYTQIDIFISGQLVETLVV